MRVATFAMNDRMLNAALKTQSRMAQMQLQEASGLVSTDYGGLGADTRKLLNLEIALARSQSYESAAGDASSRVEMTYTTLSSIGDLLTGFRTQLVAQQSANTSDLSLESLANAANLYMEELGSMLNTQFGGYYLFSGSATTTQPVDLTGYAVADPAIADTSYYNGADDVLSVRVSAEQTVTFGVNADDPAFEQAFRALGLIATGTADTATIEEALVLIEGAIDSLTAAQGRVSIAAASIERSVTAQEDIQAFLEASISSIRDVDVTTIAAQLTAYETQLQASYAALAKVQSLNLLDYIG